MWAEEIKKFTTIKCFSQKFWNFWTCRPFMAWSISQSSEPGNQKSLKGFFFNLKHAISSLKYFRIFWIFSLTLAAILFFVMIQQTTSKFFSEKIIIELSKVEHSIVDVPFPAVTVCPELLDSPLFDVLNNSLELVRSRISEEEWVNILTDKF